MKPLWNALISFEWALNLVKNSDEKNYFDINVNKYPTEIQNMHLSGVCYTQYQVLESEKCQNWN